MSRRALSDAEPQGIRLAADVWLPAAPPPGGSASTDFDDAAAGLSALWDALETNCLAACCGVEAFDFTPRHLAAVARRPDAALHREALQRLSEHLSSLTSEAVVSRRLNQRLSREAFQRLVHHLLVHLQLPPRMSEALGGVHAWLDDVSAQLDASPVLPEALRDAVVSALGPLPRLLAPGDDPSTHRGDLATALQSGGRLAVRANAVLEAPTSAMERQLASLLRLRAPEGLVAARREELRTLHEQGPVRLHWDEVVHLPTHAAAWPALRHFGELMGACARSVVPQWEAAHPHDARVRQLAMTIRPSTAWTLEGADLRDDLESTTFETVDGSDAVRAVVAAWDQLTQNPGRTEQTEVEHLAGFAWEAGPAALCHGLDEPRRRHLAWLRWWATVAVPTTVAS